MHSGWTFRGIETVVVENAWVRLDVMVGLGAKIYNLWDFPSGKNLLWHNPRRPPAPAPFGANFDDWWSGGWDDPFPNGAPTTFQGEARPYLGELWTRPWQHAVESGEVGPSLHMWAEGVITPARVDKWITLHPDQPVVSLRYRVTNLGAAAIEFMLGIHPALAVEPGSRIDVPARYVQIAEASGPDLGTPGETYAWPWVGEPRQREFDLRQVPPAHRGVYGFAYAYDLSGGWLALSAPRGAPGFALAFSQEAFPVLWLWLVYGGWRGHYHVALEPWTSFPSRIDEASRAGRTVVLAPGTVWETEVAAIVHRGWQTVTHVARDGHITGKEAEQA